MLFLLSCSFGSLIFSKTLGFIFNNQMKDFKDYGSQSHGRQSTAANYIVKGKRSSAFMSPSIVLNSNGDVSMVIGAAGGSQIPSTLAEVIFLLQMRVRDNPSPVSCFSIFFSNIFSRITVILLINLPIPFKFYFHQFANSLGLGSKKC